MDESERLDHILDRALQGVKIGPDDIKYLLALKDEDDLRKLFETAREIKKRNFGRDVFLYGFIYFTTYCRNNCTFCFYRNSNAATVRYRKSMEEVVQLATALVDSGVHLVDLTLGEDPLIHGNGDWNRLLDIISAVRGAVDVPIMVSPGVLPRKLFRHLRERGVNWYACYQETHNRALFSKLRPNQDYDVRLNTKRWAMNEGLLIEEGIMVGVGETLDDRVNSIQIMDRLGAQQVRAMGFVPQKGTPMEGHSPPSNMEEIVTIAVMRLVHQDKLIPASLDVEGLKGLRARLEAGANVVTSIIPPMTGLAGVAQHELDVNTGKRSVEGIVEVLDEMGERVASHSTYQRFVDSRSRGLKAVGEMFR
ncbi:methylornithine synthase PylB [Methermicoccus shengliensis]|uniref:Methylornithine synthase PylB n=1 Tax=Methermicoccus shengliensis TaxID=660064 RepID=A0A832RYY9_9EURY|nr:methylornithine synthase PylB [Methermicoccus shengliensis]KUK04056.1 MAG: Biotin synthase [Euryarchaeota archaeon 55_53]MDI3488605.1 methylornithine synthase [Methanosarcinales archaeon]HIH69921.1 methylornithine synthase PylB [Methermicoccus shengliensis]